MRKSWSRVFALGSLLGGLTVLVVFMSQAARHELTTATGEFILGEGIRYQNLTVFPVLARDAKDDDRFITLDEGLKAGTVVVTEMGSVQDWRRSPPYNVSDDRDHSYVSTGLAAVAVPNATPATPAEDPFGAPASAPTPAAPAAADPYGPAAPAQPAPSTQPAPRALADDVPAPPIEEKSETPQATAAANPFGPAASAPAQPASASAAQPSNEPIRIPGYHYEIPENNQVVWSIHGPANPADTGAGASVNTVQVTNRSDRPLYLMPGEIILGGQQDRTLAEETIIPPGDKPVSVAVYCVEQGRWHGRAGGVTAGYVEALSGGTVSASEAAVHGDRAGSGYFVHSAGSLGKGSRLAVQSGGGQSAVWDEVRLNNSKSGAKPDYDSFSANYLEEHVTGKYQPYIDALQDRIGKQERIVGVVVAINGKPEMADVFGSTPLFRKLWPKLLKSYALDASVAESSTQPAECSLTKARDFFDSASQSKVVDNKSNGQGLHVTQRSSDSIDTFSVGPFDVRGTISEPSGGFGGFGGGVHSAAFAK